MKATPFALDILIIFGGMKLLEVMKKDKYSEECVAAAEKLAKICIFSLVITMLSGLALNVLQVLLRNQLNDVNLVITIPVFSIMFALIVLLLAKYIRETQKVKQELGYGDIKYYEPEYIPDGFVENLIKVANQYIDSQK